ncbi:MAG: hypothetical protein PHQ52_04155 [Candidatus Omnitrophica bacterium]|nr:hypothetical protein [Candidatus Omnitrophota bacterium]
MKKYIRPKIKAIRLNAKQAILAVCSIGGAYMYMAGTMCKYIGLQGFPACPSTALAKGAATLGTDNGEQGSAPS